MTAIEHFNATQPIEEIGVPQNVTYNWEYDATRRRLMRLYENAKRDQWNSTDRLDWSIDVDPEAGLIRDRRRPRHLRLRDLGTPLGEARSGDAQSHEPPYERVAALPVPPR